MSIDLEELSHNFTKSSFFCIYGIDSKCLNSLNIGAYFITDELESEVVEVDLLSYYVSLLFDVVSEILDKSFTASWNWNICSLNFSLIDQIFFLKFIEFLLKEGLELFNCLVLNFEFFEKILNQLISPLVLLFGQFIESLELSLMFSDSLSFEFFNKVLEPLFEGKSISSLGNKVCEGTVISFAVAGLWESISWGGELWENWSEVASLNIPDVHGVESLGELSSGLIF